MRFIYSGLLLFLFSANTFAQQLNLSQCKQMALDNSRQLQIGKMKRDAAEDIRKSARTKYLPQVNAVGGYELVSKEISLLNSDQKNSLSTLGTSIVGMTSANLSGIISPLIQQGMLSPETAMKLQQFFGQQSTSVEQAGNAAGNAINDALRTNTHQLFGASVMLTQPLYMGGAITTMNRIADIQRKIADTDYSQRQDAVLYKVEETYWLIVSLAHKKQLADNLKTMTQRFADDVKAMEREGVATRADVLRVEVKNNESDILQLQAENGLKLAKMLMCQLCGLDVDSSITLADEKSSSVSTTDVPAEIVAMETIYERRPETQLLAHALDLAHQTTRLARATYLPQLALTGGYTVTNPNVYDGFHRKFGGVWNVGVLLRIPVVDWGSGVYKVRAAKSMASVANLELSEAKEKIELQHRQSLMKLEEAIKRVEAAKRNVQSADENLRCANLGFKEGVMSSSDVIAAQTAWYNAQSQKIDADVSQCMASLSLKQVQGNLSE